MSRAIHCDGPSCITWGKDGEQEFIEVMDENSDYTFCSWECVAKFAVVKYEKPELPSWIMK